MNLDYRYLGKSGVSSGPGGSSLHFSPNLARPKVFFDGELRYPLRFREAMSALHEVVVGDLRFKKKDKTAYEAWKKQEAQEEAEIKKQLLDHAKMRELSKIAKEPLSPNLEKEFHRLHRIYWDARVRWANELSRNDPELFRHLVPCDPVVTVAPDVVYFECFSKDESAYGCLSVDRDALKSQDAGLGTTNVDYSLALYEHFQTLRSYRPTRLLVDPSGFEVKVEGRDDYREEKIDLPASWLRGFGQLQAAMTLPSRRVDLPVEAVYSLLAHLKRHREKTGPRSIRFQLTPGKPPVLVLDPWGVTIQCKGPVVDDQEIAAAGSGNGPYRSAPSFAGKTVTEEIKIWGRRRLFALARVLPLAERVEVRLLGSGLPSIWIAHIGEMRLILALSGWTANDWTSGSNLELLAGSARTEPRVTSSVLRQLENEQRASLGQLVTTQGAADSTVLASLHQLAKQGQVIYDYWSDVYRYRQIMPQALSEAVLGPEHPELAEGRKIAAAKQVSVQREEAVAGGLRLYVFKAGETSAEAVVDSDGAFRKAKCSCSFFYKSRLRAGPCRHLVALKLAVLDHLAPAALPPPPPPSMQARVAPVATPARIPRAVAPPPPKAITPPPAPTPAPVTPVAKRAGVRREEVISLNRGILTELGIVSDAEDKGLSQLLEEAWDQVFERVAACRTWKEALSLCKPGSTKPIDFRSVSDPEQQSLLLHADVLSEIALLAEKFSASPSAIVNLAWLVASNRGA
ncbi:MAG: SWIM zinc finger family protein [Minicystis sp.]